MVMKNHGYKSKIIKNWPHESGHISIQMMGFPKLILNLDLFYLEKTNGHFST